MGLWSEYSRHIQAPSPKPANMPKNQPEVRSVRQIGTQKLSPVERLRAAGLLVVLAGESFRVMGIEALSEERREPCRQYYRAHEREILAALHQEKRYWETFHLGWLRDAGLELSWDGVGQVTWTIRESFQKIWDLGPGERLVNHAWQCWQYAKAHRREIFAALQPCRGWKPSRPSGGCSTLEEFVLELEKERRRGVVTFCPFLNMWIALKDCPRWCGRWADPLTDEEKKFWAVLWPDGKWPDGKQDAA